MNAADYGKEITKPALVVIGEAACLEADLIVPPDPTGVVLLVHGSGSSRLSPRNRLVARVLRERGLATMLLDTLTVAEKAKHEEGHSPIGLDETASRILLATDWLQQDEHTSGLPIGYLGAGTGAAAAFLAAAERPKLIRGIVARGGRLELAQHCLPQVMAPALLVVGSRDTPVVHHNRDAIDQLGSSVKRMEIIPGARHLFEEPGTLAAVAMHASRWFARYLPPGLDSLPTHAVVHEEI